MITPLLSLLSLLAAAAGDDQDDADLSARVSRLESENRDLHRRVDALSGELERFDLGEVFVPMGESAHGLGPAASKVYAKEQGLSIGGYGEALYTNFAGSTPSDQFDFLRAVFYFGYKFTDRWVFNSEIEFEHASTGSGGEASVEFAYVDYLCSDAVNLRGGLVLVPMGFLNELHEPPTFLSATRPLTESRIIPSTWRENGVGLFGDAGPLSYRAYLINGFDASGFSDGGLRGGRQKGARALAEDFAVVARADWTETPGLLAGGSVYWGDAGQGQAGLGDTTTTIYEVHAEVKRRGAWVRALAALAEVDDVAALDAAQGFAGADSVGEKLEGAYVEVGYDVLSLVQPGSEASVSPFVRWETVDTQAEVPAGFASDPANDVDALTFGFQVQPIASIVLKLEYQDFDGDVDRWNASLGYAF